MSFSLKRCLLTALAIFGTICFLLGIVSMFVIPKFVNKTVREQAYLGQDANGTDNEMLKMFRDPPYDVKLQVWTVSVQNEKWVVEGIEKPIVVEKGPYTFTVHLHKTKVNFAANQTRLFFRNSRTYFFNASQSCPDCLLSDRVVVPNILFQKIVDISIQHPHIAKLIIEPLLKNKESPFINISVGELLFEGYKDQMISDLCGGALKIFCHFFKIPDRIGLFYKQNGTDDGKYEVDTGVRDPDLLDKVYSFKGMKGNLSGRYWYNDTARMINGTDAELFRPNLFDQKPLEIFIGQLCRSFVLKMREPATTSGIPVFRYAQPDETLREDVQRSQGFCNPHSPDFFHNSTIQQAGCAPSGLLDMSSCLPGTPRIFLSAAHFRNVPDAVRRLSLKNESRFACPSDSDLSFFDLEPITGVVVGVQQRHQLNLGMLKGSLRMTQKMSNMIVPMIWMNESATIDSHTRERLKIPVSLVWGTFIWGLVLIIVGVAFLIAFAAIIVGQRFANFIQQSNEVEEGQNLIPAPPVYAADDPFAPPSADEEPSQPNVQQHVPIPNVVQP